MFGTFEPEHLVVHSITSLHWGSTALSAAPVLSQLHYVAKSLWIPDHHTSMSLLNMLFQNCGLQYGCGTPFAVIPSSSGKPFHTVYVGISAHYAKRTFLRSGAYSMLDKKIWFAFAISIHAKMFSMARVRAQCRPQKSLYTIFVKPCLYRAFLVASIWHSHARMEKGLL